MMSNVLRFDGHEISSEDLVARLTGYQMLPQLLREIAVDGAVSGVELTEEESVAARQQFLAQNRLTTPQAQAAWLQQFRMSAEQLETLAVRAGKVEKFKQETWGPKVEAYFIQRKAKLDQVVYSLIRTRDADVAAELYFRLLDGEAEFGELATEYSEGPEAQTGGIVGPVPLSTPHERLAQILSTSQPGQLSAPVRVGEWSVVLRLEKLVAAQLDGPTRQRLLEEMFRTWLEEQIRDKAEVIVDAAPAIGAADVPSPDVVGDAADATAPPEDDLRTSPTDDDPVTTALPKS
ncbi:MAG: peptidylprolyl isomerase [Cyanobacteria bacterium J06641_5]